jgi:hypothetical protein
MTVDPVEATFLQRSCAEFIAVHRRVGLRQERKEVYDGLFERSS